MSIKTIMLIEDEVDLRVEVIEMLTFEGYNMIGAKNGREGIKLARKYMPDIIICDIMLPEKNGIAVLKKLSKYPETASTPFIFITALSERENVRKGMTQGADDYIIKPFTIGELLDSIKAREKKAFQVENKIASALKSLENETENRIREFKDALYTKSKDSVFPIDINSKNTNYSPKHEINSEILRLIDVSNTLENLHHTVSKMLKAGNLSSKEEETFIKLLNKIREPKIISDTKSLFLMKFNRSKPEFFGRLLKKHSNLSQQDLLLCSTMILNLSGRQISGILGIEPESVYKKKYRLKKKLGLVQKDNILIYLHEFE
ncbi:MAG: response regulator [Lentimicrobiaceae bacterium]|nr:response regulator [Lentimicrobiaceae bacterium]MBT4191144.1 response regulator [Lentimicrobiaceae bacterium]MBT4800325.1 response regulator [Lentimicrobiaceae bacterium]MBT6016434.1 response regulator [Lentimicrobiaceae bacterium]MBT7622445.1 response regulator [Lentimicrobiaceae bacterium]